MIKVGAYQVICVNRNPQRYNQREQLEALSLDRAALMATLELTRMISIGRRKGIDADLYGLRWEPMSHILTLADRVGLRAEWRDAWSRLDDDMPERQCPMPGRHDHDYGAEWLQLVIRGALCALDDYGAFNADCDEESAETDSSDEAVAGIQ